MFLSTISVMRPQIDVLLPFHKIDRFFESAVESVLASTGIIINLVLIDDRNNWDVPIKSFALRGHEITYCKTSGLTGYGEALRVGSLASNSNWIALMNSDDLVSPDRFSTQATALINSDLSITGLARISETGRESRSITGNQDFCEFDTLYLLFGAYGANATWAMSRDWWDKNFCFDSEPALDWRIALKSFPKTNISFTPEVKYFYRRHALQHTQKNSPSENFDVLYQEWSALASHFNIASAERELFEFLGLPWKRNSISDYESIEVGLKEIGEAVSHKSPMVQKQISSFIARRRLIASLRSKNTLRTRAMFFARSYSEIPQFLSDLIRY